MKRWQRVYQHTNECSLIKGKKCDCGAWEKDES